jgi:hypothetical protein
MDAAVDIMFPWRKRPQPQSQQPPPNTGHNNSLDEQHYAAAAQSIRTNNMYGYKSESARMFDSSTAMRGGDEGGTTTFVGDRRALFRNSKRGGGSFNSASGSGGFSGPSQRSLTTGTYAGESTIATGDNYRKQQQQQQWQRGGGQQAEDYMSTYSQELNSNQRQMQSRQQPSRRRGINNNQSFTGSFTGGGGGGPRFRPPLDSSARSGTSQRSGLGSLESDDMLYQNQYGHSSQGIVNQNNQQQQPQRSSMRQIIYEGEEDDYIDDDEIMPPDEEEELPISPYRQLLDAINMSILPSSLRLSSLAQACEFFDHRDRAIHDAELREGAAFVLYHKLAFVLRLSRCGEIDGEMEERAKMMMQEGRSSGVSGEGDAPAGMSSSMNSKMMMNHQQTYQRHLVSSTQVQKQSEHDKEIAMICSCLEMVHRANPDAIAQTWDECGTEILPLLVSVLERPFQKIEAAVWNALYNQSVSGGGGAGNVPGSLERAVAMAVTRDQKLAVQKVTKVLAMYSLVPEAKSPMCTCVGMLRWLTRIIDTHNYNRVKPGTPAFGGAASRAASRATTTASSRVGGSLRESMNSQMSEEQKKDSEKRLELASRATSGSGLYMTEAARFNTIATLTNLAALESNRMPMLLEPGLLDNICRAVHNEHSDVPKQCSALAIMNLSNGDMDNVPEMASNDMVLETLLKLMREDNPETRRNAVVTIFNIACSDLNTVRLARYRDGMILEALTELVGSDDPVRLHDEARANAAKTLFNMACSDISETTDRMANHAGLLECLAVVLRGEHTGLEVKMYCSATLRRMAELIRYPMIAQGALLSALVKAATWTSTDCIAEAFRAQAMVPENCVNMVHHHGLLNALSRLALTKGDDADVDKVRRAAVGAIELMSRQDEARALLAHNEGIIMALTKASYGDDGSTRDSLTMDDGTYDQSYGRLGGDEDEENASVQSRRIQLALKNLVSAM